MLRDYHVDKKWNFLGLTVFFTLKLSRKVKACSLAENRPADIFLPTQTDVKSKLTINFRVAILTYNLKAYFALEMASIAFRVIERKEKVLWWDSFYQVLSKKQTSALSKKKKAEKNVFAIPIMLDIFLQLILISTQN